MGLSFIAWAVFGLLVGLIARGLYPGRQKMGLLATMALGISGTLAGGFVSWLMGYDPQDGALQGAGWILSIIGALVVVWLSLYINSSRSQNV